jgi:hypothetical protein
MRTSAAQHASSMKCSRNENALQVVWDPPTKVDMMKERLRKRRAVQRLIRKMKPAGIGGPL